MGKPGVAMVPMRFEMPWWAKVVYRAIRSIGRLANWVAMRGDSIAWPIAGRWGHIYTEWDKLVI